MRESRSRGSRRHALLARRATFALRRPRGWSASTASRDRSSRSDRARTARGAARRPAVRAGSGEIPSRRRSARRLARPLSGRRPFALALAPDPGRPRAAGRGARRRQSPAPDRNPDGGVGVMDTSDAIKASVPRRGIARGGVGATPWRGTASSRLWPSGLTVVANDSRNPTLAATSGLPSTPKRKRRRPACHVAYIELYMKRLSMQASTCRQSQLVHQHHAQWSIYI